MINTIIKIVLGVEISRNNFNIGGIIATIIVLFFGYVIFIEANFFEIIDNLLINSEQPWYSFYLIKFSFLMIFVKITCLSLFTQKNNTLGRFIAAFVTQLVGFVGIVVANTITNAFENLITDPQMKTATVIMPYLISLVVFLTIRGIYEVRNFDERKFFNTK